MEKFILLASIGLICGCTTRQQNVTAEKTPASTASTQDTNVIAAKVSTAQNDNDWKGKWKILDLHYSASLEITSVKNKRIYFTLFAMNGGHTGEIEGSAPIQGNKAVYRMEEYGSADCLIEFTLRQGLEIEVDQQSGHCDAGMAVEYSGIYKNEKLGLKMPENNLVSLGILPTQQQEMAFKKLVGSKYKDFIQSTQLVSEAEDLDDMNFKGFASGVRGLFTIMENIILYKANEFWCAVIQDEKVYYFTSSSKFRDKLPLTIENWRENFKEKEIVFMQ